MCSSGQYIRWIGIMGYLYLRVQQEDTLYYIIHKNLDMNKFDSWALSMGRYTGFEHEYP